MRAWRRLWAGPLEPILFFSSLLTTFFGVFLLSSGVTAPIDYKAYDVLSSEDEESPALSSSTPMRPLRLDLEPEGPTEHGSADAAVHTLPPPPKQPQASV